MRNTVVTLSVGVLVVIGRPAYAQEQGQIGLTMGYPASVGVVWHATDRIAIRPEMTFGIFRSESGVSATLIGPGFVSSSATTSDSWTIDTDVSVLFYLKRWDNVRTYVTPGFGYHWTTSTYTTTIQGSFTGTRTTTTDLTTRGHEIRGAFGVQYSPHRKFSVFGETGIKYSKVNGGRVPSIGTWIERPELKSLGNTAAVGIVFYFK